LKRHWFALLCFPLFAACATTSMDETACATADWRALGQSDGEVGAPSARLDRHMAACGAQGTETRRAEYLAGHADGLATYCTPRGAYVAGRQGHAYHDVCPANREIEVMSAHRDGLRVAEMAADLRKLESRIASSEQMARAAGMNTVDAQRRDAEYRLGEREYREAWQRLQQTDEELRTRYGAPAMSFQRRFF
jgi:hypothetical protein